MKNLKNFVLILTTIACCISSVYAQDACKNIALNKPATASSSTTTEIPSRVCDGNLSTNWCAPGFTGWVKVDLQHKFSVDSLKLYVNQAIDGNTVHEIKVSDDMINWTLVKTLSDNTSNNQIITVEFNTPLSDVRGVMINTTSSNSWVSWYEIEVYATLSKPTVTQNGDTLTSSSTINNQWYLDSNPITDATSQIYITTASGNYQVKVTNGCDELMSETVAITTELNEIETSGINISPNPAKNIIIVEGLTKGLIEILNIQGQLIKQVNVSDKNTSIDISNLASGIYSLKITTSEGIVVKKLLKK